MRRLFRILLDALTVLSLILFAATVALWVRSYWRWEFLLWIQSGRGGDESFFVRTYSGRGGVAIEEGSFSPTIVPLLGPGWHWGEDASRPIPYGSGHRVNRWGFRYDSIRDRDARWKGLVFPTWLAVAAFAMLPATRLTLTTRRRRRGREGHCRHCGYDLRATPDRCPECGGVPAK